VHVPTTEWRNTGWSVPARWWYLIAAVIGGVPLLWLAGTVFFGGSRTGKGFVLPEPEPVVAHAPVHHGAQEESREAGNEESALVLKWDTPERLVEAVDFLLAQGDRPAAMRLLARMAPDSEAYESALLRLNRAFVDGWHKAVAETLRECLAESKGMDAEARQQAAACLAACAPGRNRLAELPASLGASRALLTAAQARDRFGASVPDCPAAYRETLSDRLLTAFPGTVGLLGQGAGPVGWGDVKQALVQHLRARVLLPMLGRRLAQLRTLARKSPEAEDWLATLVRSPRDWREYLASADTPKDRLTMLGQLPPVVRQSWQRDAAAALLANPGAREFLVAEGALDVVLPGVVSATERGALARLVIRSPKWQSALRAMDYPLAEATASNAVETLLGHGRGDVTDLLRNSLAMERRLLGARSFPWFRVVRALKVGTTPLFWQGHAFLSPGQVAQLQEGGKGLADVPPKQVYECMLRQVSRVDEAAARQGAAEGARLYALNRGVGPKTKSRR
jgi:hypothetical protein